MPPRSARVRPPHHPDRRHQDGDRQAHRVGLKFLIGEVVALLSDAGEVGLECSPVDSQTAQVGIVHVRLADPAQARRRHESEHDLRRRAAKSRHGMAAREGHARGVCRGVAQLLVDVDHFVVVHAAQETRESGFLGQLLQGIARRLEQRVGLTDAVVQHDDARPKRVAPRVVGQKSCFRQLAHIAKGCGAGDLQARRHHLRRQQRIALGEQIQHVGHSGEFVHRAELQFITVGC